MLPKFLDNLEYAIAFDMASFCCMHADPAGQHTEQSCQDQHVLV